MSDEAREPGLSRRAWLAALVPQLGDAVAKAVEGQVARRLPPERRPPGAVSEALFLALCERCGACSEACPHGAVLTYASAAGAKAGTPILRPELRACHLCDGYPCAAACESGALTVPEDGAWRLGTVRLSTERCIAYRGPECGACVGLCPRGLEAIRLVAWRPEIDREACVGCGLCLSACPTSPPAIEMEPLSPEPSAWGGER